MLNNFIWGLEQKVIEKGHGTGKKGHGAREKRAWRRAMLKVARGNTIITHSLIIAHPSI